MPLVLVDESKSGPQYLLAATAVSLGAVSVARAAARAWIRPGQHRVHAKSESARRRRELLSNAAGIDATTVIYATARSPSNRLARDRCLSALVVDLAQEAEIIRLILERDDSTIAADRRLLVTLSRHLPASRPFDYHHQRAVEEPLLALPDLLAWSWQRGGDFRRRANAIATVRHV